MCPEFSELVQITFSNVMLDEEQDPVYSCVAFNNEQAMEGECVDK
jgi:hypothetical protein